MTTSGGPLSNAEKLHQLSIDLVGVRPGDAVRPVFHHRQPRSLESGIQQFSKGLRALAPDAEERAREQERDQRERRTG